MTTDLALNVREFSTLEQLRELEPVWNDLVLASEQPSLYLTFEWFSTWWRCHGRGRRLLVLAVHDRERVIGIAPFMKVRLAGGLITKIEFLSMMRHANSPLSFAGSLTVIAGERFEEVLASVLGHLQQNHRWQYLRLHPISEKVRLLPALEALARRRDLPMHRWPVFQSAHVSCDDGWLTYVERLSRNIRKTRRRVGRRLAETGSVKYTDYRSIEELPGGFEDVEAIEGNSWKVQTGMPIFSPRYRGFYQELVAVAGRKGWLHLRMLEVDDRKIAYDLNIEFGRQVESLKASYDAGYERFSPGLLLQWDVLERFFHVGVRRINLLWGVFAFKRRWLTHVEDHHEVFLFNRTWSARLLHLLFFRLALYARLQQGRTFALRLINQLKRMRSFNVR